jgi:alpha/beta superfamily hydrolase
MPQWIPAVWGVVVGSVATMIIGFSYGGWTTSAIAASLAKQQADAAVTAALVPVCLAQAKIDHAVLKKVGASRRSHRPTIRTTS